MARDTIDPNSKLHPRAVYNGETGRREEAPPSSLKSSNGIQLSFSFGWPKVVLRARNKNGNSRDAKIRLEIDSKEVFEAGRVNLIDERGEFVEGEEKGCSFVNRDRVPRIVMAIAQLLARTLPRHVAPSNTRRLRRSLAPALSNYGSFRFELTFSRIEIREELDYSIRNR